MLHAVPETPQALTGFTPFKLLFGRRACWMWRRRHGKSNHPLSEPPSNTFKRCRTASKGSCASSTNICLRPRLSRAESPMALPSPRSSNLERTSTYLFHWPIASSSHAGKVLSPWQSRLVLLITLLHPRGSPSGSELRHCGMESSKSPPAPGLVPLSWFPNQMVH